MKCSCASIPVERKYSDPNMSHLTNLRRKQTSFPLLCIMMYQTHVTSTFSRATIITDVTCSSPHCVGQAVGGIENSLESGEGHNSAVRGFYVTSEAIKLNGCSDETPGILQFYTRKEP